MFDAEALIQFGGLLLVLLAIYGQTGLFFCFFLPSGHNRLALICRRHIVQAKNVLAFFRNLAIDKSALDRE